MRRERPLRRQCPFLRGRGNWRASALLPLLSGAALLLSPVTAHAHAIESSLERLASLRDGLMLESRFSTGEPAAGATVRLVPPDGGTPVEVGRIDTEGRLGFSLPKGTNGTWELQVDGGPGHRDFLEFPVQQGQPRLDQLSQQSSPLVDPVATPLFRALLLVGGLSSLGGVLAGMGRPRRRG
jgi:nickel transport protein